MKFLNGNLRVETQEVPDFGESVRSFALLYNFGFANPNWHTLYTCILLGNIWRTAYRFLRTTSCNQIFLKSS